VAASSEIAALRDAGKPIRINLAVANHFSRHVGFRD